MRKADYALLAQLIANEIRRCTPSPDATDAQRSYLDGKRITAQRIANRFADRASVNKAEFLKACGIE